MWGEDVEGRQAIFDSFAKFVSALNGCEGIEVDNEFSEVFSGARFTWQDVQTTDEWNFSNLSHRESPP